MAAPLAGVRVLELARILAAPWATQLLADMGADVIKVERPSVGDDTRKWGPPFVEAADGANLGAAYFHACNRGKRSVAIDLTTAAGQAQIRSLAAEADILIENFKVGDLKRFGLDAASLQATYPRLIYCSITGFGQTGPYANRPGYDLMIQGMGGIMDLTGEPDGEPQKCGVAYADLFTGLYSTVAILASLRDRDEHGIGSVIDMALLDCQVSVLANQAMNYLVSGHAPHRLGNAHPNIVPYQTFRVADGHIVIAVGNDMQFAKLCEEIGLDIARDPKFASNADRIRNRTELVERMAMALHRFERDPLLQRLYQRGVPAGPINSVDQVFADPQVIARGMQISRNMGETVIPGVASPIVINGVRMAAPQPSPSLGEGDEAIAWPSNLKS